MIKSQRAFHSVNGKRLVMVVDDEYINRALLGSILEQEYEVLYAENGREALEKIRENVNLLSLVLLDLMMPEVNGFDVLREMGEDEALQRIPVIVLTSEKTAEVESLKMGASDFITKPYNAPEVIIARVQKTIELNEDTFIIQETEHDELTGLFNKEYFYRYAEQYDRYHPHQLTDAIVVDINHFHLVNELFGRGFGDEILRRVSQRIKALIASDDGIACRREADKFLIYCKHRDDYEDMFNYISSNLADKTKGSRVRLRMGVYSLADKTIGVEHRFDMAKSAADSIRNNYAKGVAVYDTQLHQQELFRERLLDEIDDAINEGQLKVYFQPKYNIKGTKPVLSSAEALIRWNHPEFGMLSPGIFVPLFEENGLIQKLDHFVWEQSARHIGQWKRKYGVSVPVSVNVSRVDIYDPALIDSLNELVRKNSLERSELLLEITESAYTEDSNQIIQIVETLRELGYRIEMDDFGSGYSSLSMLAILPIDALKLDMNFISNLHAGDKNYHMLRLIMGIAEHLNVPVIAEGVEHVEQLEVLRQIGCDIIQGYYFSRPVMPEEFEKFIIDKVNN